MEASSNYEPSLWARIFNPTVRRVLHYAVLVLLLVVFVGPFAWLLSVSFRGQENVYAMRLWPADPTFRNFTFVLENTRLARAFLNSVLVAAAVVSLNVLFSALAAYPLARYEFPGRKFIFILIISTLMIPFQLNIIPLFILSHNVGLIDSLWGIILPASVGAFGVYLIKQHYHTIPNALEEAARIDGASEFGIWWRIMMPLTKPAAAALAIFIFVGTWSDFLWPLIVINSEEKYTLPIAIARLSGAFIDRSQYIAAGSVIAVLPIIIFFFFAQKQFLGGLTMGGVKE